MDVGFSSTGCIFLLKNHPLSRAQSALREPLKTHIHDCHNHNMPSKAQIVATIGPASGSVEILRKLIGHQVDAIRLNFSWGTYEEHAGYIANVRQVAEELNKRVPIIQDLSGPREQETSGHHFDSEKEILTAKDLTDLAFGIDQKVEYVAMSYVGSAEDIKKLRSEMAKLGASIPVIAKIERKIAIDNVDSIIAEADAIMIARGDMGNEIPLEQIPFTQKMITEKCKAAKKPVITATQMMLSMVESLEPTRAEITDVVNAILNGSDAVMLSEESARGKHPVEVVEFMERAVNEAEKHEPKMDINPL
ncbi:MAG: Pyruvate kinase [Candidatus Yanofskybacteria bacterium GW2011_GWF1_44_227]|uniref:pyruvate kinase n=1 Tax=Candidatus Yanofskybacteria bacterium GW2011_GWE2_40_11 TaxID=1619033 RepID=A0A0G0TTB4_9BACT|nr:MAG: Pyruvate kinase [Candidatus Yanofskybacteria bacterium GW2011_GWE1_40_10]KKR41117.1 MAG: Pyruvate kinase [Candidatus Yanofskybacteria bacterium GW2011_GWE2_40_11]KKT15886.1 MAG: Pyruvate kinase [Candidatus Yanofskybacteria bacterium GW2011_GWF2_43_596]KKT53601.1 MAG: Pyruvate kinase [Candidatus Yanofskybacteria bacterium GW2011_GWF1_44_227]